MEREVVHIGIPPDNALYRLINWAVEGLVSNASRHDGSPLFNRLATSEEVSGYSTTGEWGILVLSDLVGHTARVELQFNNQTFGRFFKKDKDVFKVLDVNDETTRYGIYKALGVSRTNDKRH